MKLTDCVKVLFCSTDIASATCHMAELFWVVNILVNSAYLHLETELYSVHCDELVTYFTDIFAHIQYGLRTSIFAALSDFGVEEAQS